jgi:small-conductance mechanosensitive channel
MADKKTFSTRKYPAIYEKTIPIVLGIILLAILVVLIFIFAIALHLLPGISY